MKPFPFYKQHDAMAETSNRQSVGPVRGNARRPNLLAHDSNMIRL